MEKRASFDAKVNANNAITIPEATRERMSIEVGTNLKVYIRLEEKKCQI